MIGFVVSNLKDENIVGFYLLIIIDLRDVCSNATSFANNKRKLFRRLFGGKSSTDKKKVD